MLYDNIDNDALWWEVITGPSRVVKTLVSELTGSRSVFLKIFRDLPWRETMRHCVEYRLLEQRPEMSIEYIDCTDEDNDPALEPGRYLLERCCENVRVAHAYREGYRNENGRGGIVQYLRDKRVLKNRVLWLKGLREEHVDRWMQFCARYEPDGDPGGLFVVESSFDVPKGPLPAHIVRCDCEKTITPHDTLLFCSWLSARSNAGNGWKQYTAALASTLFMHDAEVAAFFIENTDFCTEAPVDRIYRLLAERNFDDRRGAVAEEFEAEPHTLYLARNRQTPEIERRVWKSQLQFAFPLIEEERVDFIKKYKEEVRSSLLQTGQDLRWYGRQVTEPLEAELGLLVQLMKMERENGTALLPNNEDSRRMNFLHSVRNNLAHMRCCSPKTLAKLFDNRGS
ncbi:MAG: hypothetical protein LBQ90_11975 [Synergistaceae bacterium]|jgi:hypothetical protein|nr:hypothetical protein [Synergistaceae bacterium]